MNQHRVGFLLQRSIARVECCVLQKMSVPPAQHAHMTLQVPADMHNSNRACSSRLNASMTAGLTMSCSESVSPAMNSFCTARAQVHTRWSQRMSCENLTGHRR